MPPYLLVTIKYTCMRWFKRSFYIPTFLYFSWWKPYPFIFLQPGNYYVLLNIANRYICGEQVLYTELLCKAAARWPMNMKQNLDVNNKRLYQDQKGVTWCLVSITVIQNPSYVIGDGNTKNSLSKGLSWCCFNTGGGVDGGKKGQVTDRSW